MAYTLHGHYIPGTSDNEDAPAHVARCGGIGRCEKCSREAHPAGKRRGQEPPPRLRVVDDLEEEDDAYHGD